PPICPVVLPAPSSRCDPPQDLRGLANSPGKGGLKTNRAPETQAVCIHGPHAKHSEKYLSRFRRDGIDASQDVSAGRPSPSPSLFAHEVRALLPWRQCASFPSSSGENIHSNPQGSEPCPEERQDPNDRKRARLSK